MTIQNLTQVQLQLGHHAASLLIYNERKEYLWVKRGEHAPFLANYWAFPGGMLSLEDLSHQLLLIEDEEELEKKSPTTLNDPNLYRLAHTALRETEEEIGIKIDPSLDVIKKLLPVGKWTTHPYLPKEISCQFFEVSCHTLGFSSDELIAIYQSHTNEEDSGQEVSEVIWLDARQMYDLWYDGEVTMAPPTMAFCRALSHGYTANEAAQQSPELSVLNQVQPFIQLVPLKTDTLPPATHTNCYLLGQHEFYLIDPGSKYMDELNKLFDIIDQHLAKGKLFLGCILTHYHQDHTSGLKEVIQRYKVPIYAHPKCIIKLNLTTHYTDVRKLQEGSILKWACHPSPKDDGQQALIKSSLKPNLQSDLVEVWHTPGHAPGHLCLIHPQSKTAIVGDMVAGVGTIIIDPKDGDMGTYLDNLSRLYRRQLNRLLPSHGPPLAAPHIVLNHYITHRHKREKKIEDSLGIGTSISHGGGTISWLTLAEIVEKAYDDAPPIVKQGKYGGLAGQSALAHLLHLQAQKKVLSSDPQPTVKSRWIKKGEHLSSIGHAVERLQQMMTTLRVQCPWDKAQTLDTLKRYLIEESYEVIESMNVADDHRDELGDLFFQILFQSIIQEQEDLFSLKHVFDGLAKKLSRRHPHVFGDMIVNSADEVKGLWQEIKANEKKEKLRQQKKPKEHHLSKTSVLDNIPQTAPALLRAQLIGEKAASIGFDWPSVEGSLAKVDEERIEVAEAIESGNHEHITAELGDLFFALVNVCRHLDVSPEVALENTNQTFSKRFRLLETLAKDEDKNLNDMDIDELESLWTQAKKILTDK